MPVYAVYIEKEVDYFGRRRVMGNTYHYQSTPGEPFPDEGLAQAIHDAEANVLPTDVSFTGWRTWGPTDGPTFDNVMRESGDFTDTGLQQPIEGMYREACLLVVWPMPRSETTNRRRWLRKFIRCGLPGNIAPGVYSGQDALSQSDRDYVVTNYAEAVELPSVSMTSYQLVAEDGDQPNAPPVCRPYYFTRQIGQ